MAKNRLAKVETIEEQIAKLQEQRKQELQKYRQEERKEQDKRRRTRGEILEKFMPDIVNLTIEEFTAFINKTTANQFGRDKLAEILKEGEAKSAPSVPPPMPMQPSNEKLAPPSASPSSSPPTLSEKSAPPSEKLKPPPQQPPNEKPASAPNSNESKK